MKNIFALIFSFILLGFSETAFSQNPVFSPAVFTAEDEVTLTVDVSGTPMAGAAEAYIWIFSNVSGGGKDGFTNTSWTNSPASAKMTAAGTNKWSFKFTGTTMFGQTPAELKDFGFLVKAKDGSKQTPDYKPFAFDPLVFTASKLRVFPSKVDKDDVVTINFERTLGANANEQRMQPTTLTITMYDDLGAIVGTALSINVRKIADNIWGASFIPSDSFTPPAGRKLTRFSYKFNGTVLTSTGGTESVSTSDGSVVFTEMK